MADVRVSCAGVRTEALTVPPFVLRAGEAVCLHLPSPLTDRAQEDLVRLLTGERTVPGYRPFGQILSAPPAFDGGKSLLRLFRPLRATDWLRRQARLSGEQARAAIEHIGLDQDWPLNHLAGTPRLLLGLEAAWARGADTIVFGTSGCDPSGVQAAYASVAARLWTCSAICLSHLYLQNGRLLRDHFPEAACIELRDHSETPLSAETA